MAVIDLDAVQRAAVRAFAEAGFAATGIRDISAYAGVTSGALYYHARNKEEILVSIMRLGLGTLLELAESAVTQGSGPPDQLARLVRSHVALQGTSPKTALVIDREFRSLSEHNHGEILSLRDRYEHYWAEVLQEGCRAGQFQVPDQRVTRLAMLEMCNGVATWYRTDGPMQMDDLQSVFVQLALAMAGIHEHSRYTGDSSVYVARLVCEPDLAEVSPGPFRDLDVEPR